MGVGSYGPDCLQHALVFLREAQYLVLPGEYLEKVVRDFKERALKMEIDSKHFSET